jgi:hypothetical protein
MSWVDGTKIVAECLKERGVDADVLTSGRIRIWGSHSFSFIINIEGCKIDLCKIHKLMLYNPNSLDEAARLLKQCMERYGKTRETRQWGSPCNDCK